MKRFSRIFICLMLATLMVLNLSSCSDPYIEIGESKTTYEGVSLEIKSVDYTDDGIKLNTEWINDTPYEVVYGLEYAIERYVDGEWINSMKSDISVIEIACVLAPESTNGQSYALKHADISKEGKYRIRTTGYVHESEDNVASCSLSAIFSVESGFTIAGYHRVEYQLDLEPIEDIKLYYKAGETVTVKVGKAHDLGFELYVNGEKLDMELEGDDYWQYSFVMPEAPVKITSRTYDGFTD